jgi:hypothetical protein
MKLRLRRGWEGTSRKAYEHLRWTDTWVKTPAGKWQVVATQYTGQLR